MLYTNPVCKPCERVKNFLKEHSLEWEEKNASDVLEELVEAGIRTVPAAYVEGHLAIGAEKIIQEVKVNYGFI